MRTALLIGLLVLGGCASLGKATPPGCHGTRRPANPHGSVLAPEAAAPVVAPAPVLPRAGGCGGAPR